MMFTSVGCCTAEKQEHHWRGLEMWDVPITWNEPGLLEVSLMALQVKLIPSGAEPFMFQRMCLVSHTHWSPLLSMSVILICEGIARFPSDWYSDRYFEVMRKSALHTVMQHRDLLCTLHESRVKECSSGMCILDNSFLDNFVFFICVASLCQVWQGPEFF